VCYVSNSVTHFGQTAEDSYYDVHALQNLAEPRNNIESVSIYSVNNYNNCEEEHTPTLTSSINLLEVIVRRGFLEATRTHSMKHCMNMFSRHFPSEKDSKISRQFPLYSP
jgi:hypothetical protein